MHEDSRPPAHCRHCPAEITRLTSGIWADAAGFPACVKGGLWRDPITDAVHRRPAVNHEPMPPPLECSP